MSENKLTQIRLNKYLTTYGLASSRRKADIAIENGKVSVNGQIAKIGQKVHLTDQVRLNGQSGKTKTNITILFNKPVGYVCSHAHQGNQKTIFELLPKSFANLKIAGRLDKQSCGLVILSSDGNTINYFSHPTNNKQKVYIVKLSQGLTLEQTKALKSGIKLSDGISKFSKISKLDELEYRLSLSEGRNRQIRRTFEALGVKVVFLKRIQIGEFKLGRLAEKSHQFLPNSKLIGIK